jgi:S-adenosylmethionine synthetase
MADQVSDAVLDAALTQDSNARVACEVLIKNAHVIVAGEMSLLESVDVESLTRKTIQEIGYNDIDLGFDWQSCSIISLINAQSPDIALGINRANQGAGDQGIMFGYACRETAEFMPAPILYAHRLVQRQAFLRKSGKIPWLGPDAKSQISLQYRNKLPDQINTVVFSTQHTPQVKPETVREAVMEMIIKPSLPSEWIKKTTRFLINPTGRFVVGGPVGDTGLTGRKIIVDSYGGVGRHGGGCFSGKDPSKVDRSGAYIARKIAKNIVAAGLADLCEIQLAYTIGMPEPTALYLTTFGTGKIPESRLIQIIYRCFDLSLSGIIKELDLLKPIYKKTSVYGHFGRCEPEFTWELLDKIESLQKEAYS